ncbi:MAG: hypothetical protein Kow0040_14810 [Thermogutta sp.]
MAELPLPYTQLGWLGIDAERQARDAMAEAGLLVEYADCRQTLYQAGPPDPKLQKPVWELCKEIIGRDLIPGRQETGDCVSWGVKQAGERRQVIEIAAGEEERFRPWFAPWIYAVSRNQIGGGLNGAGSTGAWAAAAIAKYGILFEDDEGVPPYSGEVADQWGSQRNVRNPVYDPFFATARDNPCKAVRLSSVEQVVEMIRDHRYPVTIASSRGFRMQPREYRGHHVFTPAGVWYHQMCLIEYNPDLPAVYRLNSWGPDAHGEPLNGETPGGAWNLLDDLASEIAKRDVELYALVAFAGEPAQPDHHVL